MAEKERRTRGGSTPGAPPCPKLGAVSLSCVPVWCGMPPDGACVSRRQAAKRQQSRGQPGTSLRRPRLVESVQAACARALAASGRGPSSMPWPPGAGSPGSWLRHEPGTSHWAAQGRQRGSGALVWAGRRRRLTVPLAARRPSSINAYASKPFPQHCLEDPLPPNETRIKNSNGALSGPCFQLPLRAAHERQPVLPTLFIPGFPKAPSPSPSPSS